MSTVTQALDAEEATEAAYRKQMESCLQWAKPSQAQGQDIYKKNDDFATREWEENCGQKWMPGHWHACMRLFKKAKTDEYIEGHDRGLLKGTRAKNKAWIRIVGYPDIY